MKTPEMLALLEHSLEIEGHEYDTAISRLIRICFEQQRRIRALMAIVRPSSV